MWRRLPVVAVLALGAWLWRSNLLPQSRDLVWRLDGDRGGIERVEIQLWNAEGALLKREEFFIRSPSDAAELIQHVSLPGGDFTARLFIDRRPVPIPPIAQTVHLGDEAAITLTVPIR